MKSELRKSAILTHPMLPKAHFSGSERPSDAEKEEDLRARTGLHISLLPDRGIAGD
jgi:hypothetical protein